MDVGLLENADQNYDIAVYPNPAADYTSLDFSSEKSETAAMSILSVDGKKIMEENITLSTGNNLIKVNTTSLSNGLYFIQIKSASSSLQSKVLVNH